MMNKKAWIFILLLLWELPAGRACYWTTDMDLNGKPVQVTENRVVVDVERKVYQQNKKKAEALVSEWESGVSTRTSLNTYGVSLARVGRIEDAKKVFIAMEKAQPGQYKTAANLGTTYELLGMNDSALVWIEKAIKINPGSHFGSEWIHVKILEAKLAGKKQYQELNLLGISFGEDEIPTTSFSKDALKKILSHATHQLYERLEFVPMPDPWVAAILFDCGNIQALTEGVGVAMQTYELARKYGFNDPLLDKRIKAFKKIRASAKTEVTADGNPAPAPDTVANINSSPSKSDSVKMAEEMAKRTENLEERKGKRNIVIVFLAATVGLAFGYYLFSRIRGR